MSIKNILNIIIVGTCSLIAFSKYMNFNMEGDFSVLLGISSFLYVVISIFLSEKESTSKFENVKPLKSKQKLRHHYFKYPMGENYSAGTYCFVMLEIHSSGKSMLFAQQTTSDSSIHLWKFNRVLSVLETKDFLRDKGMTRVSLNLVPGSNFKLNELPSSVQIFDKKIEDEIHYKAA